MKPFILSIIIFFVITTQIISQSNWFTTGQDADLMLSGVDFNNTGGPLMFNHPMGLSSDGTRFILSDTFNNRVLIWNTLPEKWDDNPDLVLGQPDFYSNNPGMSKSEFNWPVNVSLSPNGTIGVADANNHRILIWKTFPTNNAQPADISISYKEFPEMEHGVTEWPWGVWTDGNRLVSTATRGGYIYFWNSIPASDNQVYDYSIHLPEFGTPRNISTDGSTFFFVGDHNGTINGLTQPITFFWNTFPTTKDQRFDWTFPAWIKGNKTEDGKLVASGFSSVHIWNTIPTNSNHNPDITLNHPNYENGDGPDAVAAGEYLFANNYNGTNTHVYKSIPTSINQTPDFALGSHDIKYNSLNSINFLEAPVPATNGQILLATSGFRNCLWLWKTINPSSGQAPDIKIDLESTNLGLNDNAIYNNKLVAAGFRGNLSSVGIWNSLPVNGELPSKIFFDKIGNVQFKDLMGIALDSIFFYLGQSDGNIYIWRNIPTTGDENYYVNIKLPSDALQQLNSDGEYFCATTYGGVFIFKVSDIVNGNLDPYKQVLPIFGPDFFKFPLNMPMSAVTNNGSLAIVSNGSHAVYLWKNIEDAGDPDKVIILGQESLNKIGPSIGKNRLFMPAAMCAYKNQLWIGEYKFSSRLLRFSYYDPTELLNDSEIPDKYKLSQNYPNPFNPTTTISFSIPESQFISLMVYDILGREISTLVNEEKQPGNYKVNFDGSNLSSGVYYYQMRAGQFVETKKLILLK
ncbi:MAG TPA: T9SS type A sorting domain-containing protein [Melioribacteraceae bacterium]|nr:T9SS type A sorting domain-containing protein [Melioribacteraceae bacterium]